MMMSLFLGLKEDFGLNLSATKDCALFMKCYISRIFLPYSSNSVCNFAQSILLAVRRNFKLLDSNEISEVERFPLETFITFLPTHLPSSLTPIYDVMLFLCKTFFRNCRDRTVKFFILLIFRIGYFKKARLILTSLRSIIHLLVVFISFI